MTQTYGLHIRRNDARISKLQAQGKETEKQVTMLESNLAPKGSPAAGLCTIFMLLRLRMSFYAYAYRTCKHLCAYVCDYAYPCVVRVNQA